MAYDFSTLDEARAIALIATSTDTLAPLEPGAAVVGIDRTLAKEVRAFLAGDHWQGGDGWVGPKPSSTVGGTSDEHAMALFEAHFVSRNMIEDITTRHTDGVLGREPAWGFTPKRAMAADDSPTDAEQAQIDTIEAALTAWWDKRKCHALFQRVGTEAILSGRAVIRLYVPAGLLVPTESAAPADAASGPKLVPNASAADEPISDTAATDGQPVEKGVVAPTLEDALDQIFVEVVTSEDGTVYTDTDSMERIGVVRYFRQGTFPGSLGPRVIETTFLGGDAKAPRADRPTVIRIVGSDEAPVPLPLNGHLTHYAVLRPPLVNSSIVSIQKALNFAMSMLPRNLETAGFTERTLLNAEMPGEYVEDPTTGKQRLVQSNYRAGAGTTNFVTGKEMLGPDGVTPVLATPSIQYREPSPITPTTDAIDAMVAEILREAKQAHVLGTDQVQSGVSRVQARADFEKSLGRTQAAVEPAGRWLLETALTMACVFANDTAGVVPENFRATFSCYTDTGPLDPQEKTTVTQAVQLGILSREWGMQALGVEDVDAELARLNSEPGKSIDLRQKKALALKAFTDAGLSLGVAAQLAGFEDDEIAEIKADELANPTPAPVPGTMQPALNADGTPKVNADGTAVMEPVPVAATPVPPAPPAVPAPAKAAA